MGVGAAVVRADWLALDSIFVAPTTVFRQLTMMDIVHFSTQVPTCFLLELHYNCSVSKQSANMLDLRFPQR
jgi:hypothetical protein